MRFFFLIPVLLSSQFTFCQTSASDNVDPRDVIKADFSKIPPGSLTDLIPFYENEKWGYIDKKTKKVILPAKYEDLDMFNPNMWGVFNSVLFFVDSVGNVKIKEVIEEEASYVDVASSDYSDFARIVSSRNGYKGFAVDSKGNLESYSDVYQYNFSGFHSWNVRPFKLNGHTFAVVVNKEGNYAVIDSVGNPMPGFEFNYKSILLNRYADNIGEQWFFVSHDEKNYSLLSSKLEWRMKDGLTMYPLTSLSCLGYGILQKDDKSGLFDYREMKWIMPLQNKVRFTNLDHSSKQKLNRERSVDREKASVFIEVLEKEQRYYIDLKGKKYLPKK